MTVNPLLNFKYAYFQLVYQPSSVALAHDELPLKEPKICMIIYI